MYKTVEVVTERPHDGTYKVEGKVCLTLMNALTTALIDQGVINAGEEDKVELESFETIPSSGLLVTLSFVYFLREAAATA